MQNFPALDRSNNFNQTIVASWLINYNQSRDNEIIICCVRILEASIDWNGCLVSQRSKRKQLEDATNSAFL